MVHGPVTLIFFSSPSHATPLIISALQLGLSVMYAACNVSLLTKVISSHTLWVNDQLTFTVIKKIFSL